MFNKCVYNINKEYNMVIEIFNENGCPPFGTGWERMQGGDYRKLLSILEWLKVPNMEIVLLDIDNIEKGVTDWQRFGRVLKEKFPNLKAIVVKIGEYKNDKETDLYEAAERFFVEMQLDFLEITCKQFTKEDTTDKSTEHYKISVYDPPSPEPPRLCCVCEKDEDLNMCEECQGRYLLKIPHRNLITCVHGHIYEECPNHATWRYNRDSNYNCGGSSDHCPVCKHDIPYVEFLAHLQTNIGYQDLLKKYMSEGDANECWFCWPCL